jgi:hypothetical protein
MPIYVSEITTISNSRTRVLLEKLIMPDPLKKFPVFYETQVFITVFTRAND